MSNMLLAPELASLFLQEGACRLGGLKAEATDAEEGEVRCRPRVVIVSDTARRPLISVTESSWSEVPPLCKHGPAHARELKKISVCRWSGEHQGDKSSTTTRSRTLSRELSMEPAIVTGSGKAAVTDPSPRRPDRKASLRTSQCSTINRFAADVVAATNENALPGATNKKMTTSRQNSSGPRKPNRRESLIASLSDLRKPMRKASFVGMAGLRSDSCLHFEPDEEDAESRHQSTIRTPPTAPTRRCSDSEFEMSSSDSASLLHFEPDSSSHDCQADDTPLTYYSSDSEYELSSNSCLNFEPEEEKEDHPLLRPAKGRNSSDSSIQLRKPERKASLACLDCDKED